MGGQVGGQVGGQGWGDGRPAMIPANGNVEPACEWLEHTELSLPAFPPFPEGGLSRREGGLSTWSLPPIPRLLPTMERLRLLSRKEWAPVASERFGDRSSGERSLRDGNASGRAVHGSFPPSPHPTHTQPHLMRPHKPHMDFT